MLNPTHYKVLQIPPVHRQKEVLSNLNCSQLKSLLGGGLTRVRTQHYGWKLLRLHAFERLTLPPSLFSAQKSIHDDIHLPSELLLTQFPIHFESRELQLFLSQSILGISYRPWSALCSPCWCSAPQPSAPAAASAPRPRSFTRRWSQGRRPRRRRGPRSKGRGSSARW